jgi:DNA gyrase/topoisomerase IV subunit A
MVTWFGDRLGGMRHDAVVDGDPEFDRREHVARELDILEGLTAALERWIAVSEVIEASDDTEDAVRRLRDLLGVSETVASEVLNTQWRRLTRQNRAEIIERRDELRAWE